MNTFLAGVKKRMKMDEKMKKTGNERQKGDLSYCTLKAVLSRGEKRKHGFYSRL